MTALRNIQGLRFGRLYVVRRDGTKRRKAIWLCKCDCGNDHRVVGIYLTSGRSQSCGCLQRELISARKTIHGATRKLEPRWPEYGVWQSMINRCHLQTVESYPRYGGRGISVCDRWRNGQSGETGFQCFIADMGRRPDPSLSIDRKDNDGNYEPGNCRWATAVEQAGNRRNTRKIAA